MRFSQAGLVAVALILVAARSAAQAEAEPTGAPEPAGLQPSAAERPDPAPQPEPASPPQPTAASSGPAITLPPESGGLEFGVSAEGDEALTRGLEEERVSQDSTVVGGYGQFTLNALRVGPDDENDFITRANVRRLVLFVAHPITDDIRVYSEFEWENAIACDGCNGSAEVEQAYVDWQLLGDALSLRAGLVLVPLGIINHWHEPPVFHGVDRPQVDTVVIPTTWRELGLGVTGRWAELWRYELYLTTTLDPMLLDASGLRPALSLGSLARADAFAVTGRVEVEPVLGVIAGLGFFASDLGGNGEYFTRNGRERDLTLPLVGYAVDARMRRWGLEARVVWSQFFFPNAGDLIETYREDGSPSFPNLDATGPVPTRIEGGYVELAYDVFHALRLGHELLPFVRLEMYDTQAGVPDDYDPEPALDGEELTIGLTYRPIPQLAFKTDLQLRDRRYGLDELQVNVGFGYMF